MKDPKVCVRLWLDLALKYTRVSVSQPVDYISAYRRLIRTKYSVKCLIDGKEQRVALSDLIPILVFASAARFAAF